MYQFVEKLIELGEISYTNVFIDGTKIEANANKYSFVWAKAVKKNLIKLNAKIEAETRELAAKYGYSDKITFENLLNNLMLTATVLNVTFVHGKGKRKTQLQRDIDKLIEYGNKRHEYLESLKIAGKRNSYSKIDTDATFMRMKEDYRKPPASLCFCQAAGLDKMVCCNS